MSLVWTPGGGGVILPSRNKIHDNHSSSLVPHSSEIPESSEVRGLAYSDGGKIIGPLSKVLKLNSD